MRQLLSYVLMFTFNAWRKNLPYVSTLYPLQTIPIYSKWLLVSDTLTTSIPLVCGCQKKYPLKLPFPHMFPSPTWLPARDRLTEVEAVASHMCPNFTRRWRFECLEFFCICVKVYLIFQIAYQPKRKQSDGLVTFATLITILTIKNLD